MKCEKLQLKLLRKGAESALNRRRRKHLRDCPDCRLFADSLEKTAAELRAIDYGEPGRSLDNAVKARVRRLSRRQRTQSAGAVEWVRRWHKPLAAAGAAMLTFGLFLWYLNGTLFFTADPPGLTKEKTETNFHQEDLFIDEEKTERILQTPGLLTELEEMLWELEAELALMELDFEEDYQIWYAEVE